MPQAGTEALPERFLGTKTSTANTSEKAKCANTDKDVHKDYQKIFLATGTGGGEGKVPDWSLGSTSYADTRQAPNPVLHRLL